MNELVECRYCNSRISDTAIWCPICGKETQPKDSIGKKVTQVTAGVAAGTAGVIVSPVVKGDVGSKTTWQYSIKGIGFFYAKTAKI